MTDNKRNRSRQGRRTFLKAAGASGAIALTGLSGCLGELSGGQEYPSQDVEMIVPWAAGGGTDRTGRKLAELASEEMDTSFYVSNQTGATGSVGWQEVANADPDGYTVGVQTVEICVINHMDISDLQPSDHTPIMQYNFDPASLTVHQDAEYDTVDEFVQYAKDNPGEINISNSGSGSIWHLSAAGFANETGIDVKHVPYDGGAPATKAVVNGEVQATTASGAEVAPQVNDGPLKTIGIMGEERLENILPDAPTMSEAGYDFTMGAWRGLAVPNETPQERIDALHEAYKAVYDSDEFKQFMQQNGFGLTYRNAEEYEQFQQDQYEMFGNLVEELNLNN